MSHERRRHGRAIARGATLTIRHARVGAGHGAAVHFLFLPDSELGLEEAVFAAELGDFGSGAGGAGDAADLHGRLEPVEALDAHVEVVLERLHVFHHVALDAADAAAEAAEHAFDRFDGVQEVLAEAGQHGRDDFEGWEVPADEAVLVLPVVAAQGGETVPECKEEVVAFLHLLPHLLLKSGEFLFVGGPAGFQLSDLSIFLSDSSAAVLMRLLPMLVLCLVRSPSGALLLQEL